MDRRDALRCFGGVVLALPALATGRAQQADSLAALADCIDHHRKYKACFVTKFRTGYCSFDGFDGVPMSPDMLTNMLAMAGARLASLSLDYPTAALLYHARGQGDLDVFLLDSDGLVAWERVTADLEALTGGLRAGLSVDTRMATRAAVPMTQSHRKAEASAAPVGLDTATSLLLPRSVGDAFAAGGYSRVLVLPSGALDQVPLAALRLPDGQFMVDQASVLLVADPETLFLDERNFAGGLSRATDAMTFSFRSALYGAKLMVGNPTFGKVEGWTLPPLPGAEAEIESVAGEFWAKDVLAGKRATRKAVMARLREMKSRGGIAYFATHGVSDPVNPMDGSFLAVADGLIRGQQIRELHMALEHPLIVMSACQSGLGKTFGGGGYGLARAWYAAGAGQVVGSLWNVSDEGTTHLMTRFARNAVSGMIVEEALREAMRHTRDNFSSDPAIWASFVSLGNPGA